MPYQQKYKAVARMSSPYAKLGHSNSVAMQQKRYVLESDIEAATEGNQLVPELGGQLQEVIVTNPKTGTTTNSTSSTSTSNTNVKTGKKKRRKKLSYKQRTGQTRVGAVLRGIGGAAQDVGEFAGDVGEDVGDFFYDLRHRVLKKPMKVIGLK